MNQANAISNRRKKVQCWKMAHTEQADTCPTDADHVWKYRFQVDGLNTFVPATEGLIVNCSPVDCKWDEWTIWSPCSKTCVGGIRQRSRNVLEEAKYGGKSCRGDSKEFEPCNDFPCSGPGER